MPNTTYPRGAEKILKGQITIATGVKAALMANTYTYSAAHEFLSDLTGRVGTDQALANVVVAGGAVDADDLDFGTIAAGSTCNAIVLYKDTGNASTSPLIAYFDMTSIVTNGGGVTVPWDNGPKKIFRIPKPFYPSAVAALLAGTLNLSTADLRVALLPDSYTYDAAHDFLDDVPTPIDTPIALASKSVTLGVLDGGDVEWATLVGGSTVGKVLIYKHTGTPSTSNLVLLFDDVVGLPFATNGGGFKVAWNNGAAKIVSIVPA